MFSPCTWFRSSESYSLGNGEYGDICPILDEGRQGIENDNLIRVLELAHDDGVHHQFRCPHHLQEGGVLQAGHELAEHGDQNFA